VVLMLMAAQTGGSAPPASMMSAKRDWRGR
jgi:hypothetical protein